MKRWVSLWRWRREGKVWWQASPFYITPRYSHLDWLAQSQSPLKNGTIFISSLSYRSTFVDLEPLVLARWNGERAWIRRSFATLVQSRELPSHSSDTTLSLARFEFPASWHQNFGLMLKSMPHLWDFVHYDIPCSTYSRRTAFGVNLTSRCAERWKNLPSNFFFTTTEQPKSVFNCL